MATAKKTTAPARTKLAAAPKPPKPGHDPRGQESAALDPTQPKLGSNVESGALPASPPTPTKESQYDHLEHMPGNSAVLPGMGAEEPPKRVKLRDVSMVKVHVPKTFHLTDEHGRHTYLAGTPEMPKDHAEHWYAQAHGVEVKDKE